MGGYERVFVSHSDFELAANYDNRHSADVYGLAYRALPNVAKAANHENMDVKLNPPVCQTFLDVVETIISSGTEVTGLAAELGELLRTEAISCNPPGERTRGYPIIFSHQRRQAGSTGT